MFETYYTIEEQERIATLFKPPEILTGSEWANKKLYLSKEDSAEHGKYSTDRAPFQKEILDEITNPLVEKVPIILPRQIGKTTIAKAIIGYYTDQEPSPMMYLIETISKAENFSKVRLDAMIRDNDWMKIDRKVKSSGNTILEKHFPGGYLSMTGANSPTGLSSKVIRVLIADEVDGYPISAGGMGSPFDLAVNTTETFDNRKIILISTPGKEGLSVIWPEYELSDQRKYWVPCLHCGEYQLLDFERLIFKNLSIEDWHYKCIKCEDKLFEKNKFEMLAAGEWRATFPERENKPGFHLNRLYSPFSSWNKTIEEFIVAKNKAKEGSTEKLQVFINCSLAKLWNPWISPTSVTELEKRTEKYFDEKEKILPSKVYLLTAGIDTQDDRLEIELTGWGLYEESWLLDYKILTGEPALPGLWKELDEYLKQRFIHPLGIRLGITAAGIDIGGHHAQQVAEFVRYKTTRRIYALHGSSTPGRMIAPRKPSKNNKYKVPIYTIGTETGKDTIYTRLRISEHGPGFMHFEGRFCDEEYFKQLTSNKKVMARKGYRYELIPGRRDEALDCKNYSLAALKIYNRDLIIVKKIVEQTAKLIKEEREPRRLRTKRRSFATR